MRITRNWRLGLAACLGLWAVVGGGAGLGLVGWGATARADQAAVQIVLGEMQRAVLAADVDAYLKHVSASDPVFRKEQENWAADLKLHKPVEFELTIVEPAAEAADEPAKDGQPASGEKPSRPAREFGPDRAVFTLKTRWTMGEDVGGAAAKPRDVSFPVVFAREDDGVWRYRGEHWLSVARPADKETGFAGVLVMHEPGLEDHAAMVAAVMPEVRSKVDALFGAKIDRVQEVKLYSSMRHLQHSIYLSYKDGLGGWNEPGESVKILSRGKPRERNLKVLLGHEYGHVATFELGPKSSSMPWWVLEGVADFCGGEVVGGDGKGADRTIAQWRDSGALAAWADLADFRNIKPELTRNVYRQGEHFVRWFTSKHGGEVRTAWLREMARGASLEDATKHATGATFAEADARWREAVAALGTPESE